MKIAFITKEIKRIETKTEIELPILEKVTYLHYQYSGGYNYVVKFIPSSYSVGDKTFYILDFVYGDSDFITKGRIQISPFNSFPDLTYNKEKQEFDYVGQKHRILSNDYLEIIANYWLSQIKVSDCFFNVITEQEFKEEIEKFIN